MAEQPYRVIIRSRNKKLLQKAVDRLVSEFKGDAEFRIGRIHRG